MNNKVCLDSQIFGWVFRDDAPSPESAQKYAQSEKLVKNLKKAGYKIVIPEIMLSEIACPLPESKQIEFYDSLA